MKPKLIYSEKALSLILEALEIKTDIPHDKIIGIKKGNDGPIIICHDGE